MMGDFVTLLHDDGHLVSMATGLQEHMGVAIDIH
jgi:hypothetical protein